MSKTSNSSASSTSPTRICEAFKAAFPATLPILASYWFLGVAYGLLMARSGFSWSWPALTATVVYSGSVEFLSVDLLSGDFAPLGAFSLALLICARHLFYGVSMLGRYAGLGWKRFFLIYGLSDETFAVNYTADPPPAADRGWFMLFVTALNFFYWLSGTLMGSLAGALIPWEMRGLKFVMTAMFVTIFMENWMKERDHRASLLGLAVSAGCLVLFGAQNFVVPAMAVLLAVFIAGRPGLERKEART